MRFDFFFFWFLSFSFAFLWSMRFGWFLLCDYRFDSVEVAPTFESQQKKMEMKQNSKNSVSDHIESRQIHRFDGIRFLWHSS